MGHGGAGSPNDIILVHLRLKGRLLMRATVRNEIVKRRTGNYSQEETLVWSCTCHEIHQKSSCNVCVLACVWSVYELGMWYSILQFINMVGVITNACLIAFTSKWGTEHDVTGQLAIVIAFEVRSCK